MKELNELAEWASGRNPIVVLFAVEVVATCDEVHDGIKAITSGQNLPERMPPPPNIATWLTLYRKHNDYFDLIGTMWGLDVEGEFSATALARWWRATCRLAFEEKKAAIDAKLKSGLLSRFESTFKDLGSHEDIRQKAYRDLRGETEIPDDIGKSMANFLGFQFLARVWLPCYALYREYPTRLLNRARHGDIDAIDQLLRVDKSIITEARIAQHWHEAAHASRKARFRRMVTAIKGRPVGDISLAKIKRALAGLIVEIGQLLGENIEEPDVRRLFDIVAKLRRGTLRDVDIPAVSDTFSKGIRRERAAWRNVFKTDKSRARFRPTKRRR